MKKSAPKAPRLALIKIFGQVFREWFQNFNTYSKIVLVVAIPVAILTVLQADGNTGDFGLTMAFAWSFTIIALVMYATVGPKNNNDKLAGLYSNASGRFLQYIGVSIALIIMAVPGVAGWLGIIAVLGGSGSGALALLIAGGLGIIISIFLLVRFGLAQVLTVSQKTSVYKSLKASYNLSKKHFLGMFVGYLIILLGVFLIANGIQLVLSIRQNINENIYINNLVYILEATVFLPIFYIYQSKLLKALHGEG